MLTPCGNTLWKRSPAAATRRRLRGCAALAIVCAVFAATGGCYRWQQRLDPFTYFDPDEPGPAVSASANAIAATHLQHVVPLNGVQDGTATLGTVPQEFTIEQALLYTLDNHPRLRARQQEVEVARAELITAGLLPNPQLVVDTDAPINESGPVELSGRLMFTIPTGGKRAKAAAAARAGIAEAQAAISVESQLLLSETAAAAMEVLYLQELIQLQRELGRLAEEAARLQRARVEQAVAPATQALAAEINAAEIQFDAFDNETLLANARMRLSRAMGLPRPQEVRVLGALEVQPFPKPPLEELLAEAVLVRPELARAEAAIERSRRDVVAAQANARPNVELGPRYQTELGEQEDMLGVRFGTDLPWFDRNQGNIYEAASQSRVNEAARDEVRITSLHDLAAAFQQLQPIELALAQYEQTIAPLARRTEGLMRDPEAALVLDPVVLTDQLRKLAQIRIKHLRLRYQHNQIRTTLELLLGRRLTPEMMSPPELVPPGRLDPMPQPPAGL